MYKVNLAPQEFSKKNNKKKTVSKLLVKSGKTTIKGVIFTKVATPRFSKI